MAWHDRAYEWVGDWSRRRASLSPDRTAVVDATTDESFTYADLDDRANCCARLLRDRGVATGDRVALVSRNRVEAFDCFFATGKLGAVLAPLSHRLAPPELGELLDLVAPTVLVVEDAVADAVTPALDHATVEPSLLVLESAEGDADVGAEHVVADSYENSLPGDASPVDGPKRSMSDVHLLLHTGGSTGTPKETKITHESIYWNSFNTITSWGLRPDDVTPMVFPTFHTGGWNVLTLPLFHVGGTLVIDRTVEPERVLAQIAEHAATILVAVPAVLRMMANHDDWGDTDLSSLRFVKSGGGPCRESVVSAWRDRDVDISQGYGLTECGPNNFAMPDDWTPEKVKSVGKPVLHNDVRIVDEDGQVLPQGEIGELELAGPHAADGYWENPAETEATFGAWVSTGDLAREDADGFYHIEGRKKNMFVSGGENVFPPMVEDAISDHPAVEEVVVIGVPDDQWGTVGKAVVEGDESLDLEALREFLSDRLAKFEIPHHLAFVDEMPTSGPSKIDRSAIEAQFGADE